MADAITKPSLWDKVKLIFVAKKAYEQISSAPKSSFLSGEFWVKIAAAVCTIWAGVHNFVPHPIDVYITVGLALWVSAERLYLKKKHLDVVADLSSAPSYDSAAMTQILSDLVGKFPKLAPVIPTAQSLADKLGSPEPVAPAPVASVPASTPA